MKLTVLQFRTNMDTITTITTIMHIMHISNSLPL